MSNVRGAAIFACGLALSLCACVAPAPAPVATDDSPVHILSTTLLEPFDSERIDTAINLLGDGKPGPAHAELQAVLAKHPTNRRARRLMDQIEQDPKVLLGEKAYAYRVQPGETLSVLAQRFLGDPLLFYALARYNNIATPSAMKADQVLLIPGTPKKPPAPKTVTGGPEADLRNLFARAAVSR